MEPISAQAAFDNALNMMRAREYRPALVNGSCKYRSPIGPCAIGVSIPDELYSRQLDYLSKSFDGVSTFSPELAEYFKHLVQTRSYVDLDMLCVRSLGSVLQGAHDRMRDTKVEERPEAFEAAMQNIAHRWELEYSAPV